MSLVPSDIYKELVNAGDAWAEAQYNAELLEETKKTILAHLISQSTANSMSAKETDAMASADYEKHIRGMVAARKIANKAKVKYDSCKILAELRRTESANLRATMRDAT